MYADGVERRQFIQALAAGAPLLFGAGRETDLSTPFASAAMQDVWDRVREQFIIPRDRIYLNTGTLGVQPRAVIHAVTDATYKVAQSLPPGVNWQAIKEATAALLDCDADGLAFPRNTTEAMNFVAQGIDYRPGDHIVTTSHEHIGGLSCWQLVAARYNLQLTQVLLPPDPRDPEQIFQQIKNALTPRTRVVSVSHVNFTTGFIMPVRDIAALCRERGIISVIDGAHPPGLMPVSIRQIGLDFYASSPHKWLLAPQGTGLLWIAPEWRTRLWPGVASGDWDRKEIGAHRFNHLGTIDESRYAGYQAALAFHLLLEPSRVYARIEELRQHLFGLLEPLPDVQLVTPREQSAGMVSFRPTRMTALELQRKLAEHNVRTRVIGEYDYGFMRLSPHIYNSMSELERVAQLIAQA